MGSYLGPAPESLDAAIIELIKVVNEKGPQLWEELEEGFVNVLHHQLGREIRNEWGLWSQDSELYRKLSGEYMLSHADDISGLILRAVYRTYHDEDLELAEKAAQFHDFWAKSLRGEPISIKIFHEG